MTVQLQDADKVRVRTLGTTHWSKATVNAVADDSIHVRYASVDGRGCGLEETFVRDGEQWASRPLRPLAPVTPIEIELVHRPQRWVVVTWKRANVGGEDLALYVDDEVFVLSTGPTPWGSGSWGPFPRTAISAVRPLRADDSWPVAGTLNGRWTPRGLLAAYRQARGATLRSPSVAEITLSQILEALDG